MTPAEFRPGLEGVIADESAICEVHESSGDLLYRGYRIGDLAEHATFEEVAYLLLQGELPRTAELAAFRAQLSEAAAIPETVVSILGSLPAGAHPMDLLRTAVAALGCLDPQAGSIEREALLAKSTALLARLPVVTATAWRLANDREPIEPEPGLYANGVAAGLLYLITGQAPDTLAARALDVSLILYAEHQFNASTFAARVTASALSDLYSAITSAIGTLKGPLHGGANERVMAMLKAIGRPEDAEPWTRTALERHERIMGFGHRVYKHGDSRSEIIKEWSRRLGEARGETNWFAISEIIERLMADEKGFYPNLDFYSASTYAFIGLAPELYTPVFACSRVAGWCAHVIEQIGHNRLIRPRCRYTGPAPRAFLRLDER